MVALCALLCCVVHGADGWWWVGGALTRAARLLSSAGAAAAFLAAPWPPWRPVRRSLAAVVGGPDLACVLCVYVCVPAWWRCSLLLTAVGNISTDWHCPCDFCGLRLFLVCCLFVPAAAGAAVRRWLLATL